jgi:GntR family transcriptional regulator of vanillate catabolism
MMAKRVKTASTNDSQTLRALLAMRELLVTGAFKPGERIREVPLSARLKVSRTPLRLVLDRLEQEGLLRARPTGGFVAREFSVGDVRDAIELRGVLEGTAARFAAEQQVRPAAVDAMQRSADAIDRLFRRWRPGMPSFLRYVALNAEFHTLLLEAASSPMLERSMQVVATLPFASPNAFVMTEAQGSEVREVLSIAQAQHRAIVEAISNREGARAESVAREHSRLARTNLENALRHRRLFTQIPGASLIKLPHAV